jgi:hypothetical protein
MSKPPKTKLPELLSEVEDLCVIYVGKDAEGETWIETSKRLVRINRLVKAVRKER